VSSDSELNDQEKFLIEKLHIPDEWIYEYKALRAKYEHQHKNQFELLLKAHRWNEAHTILIEHLAPDMFVRKNFKSLHDYLAVLAKEGNSISKWNTSGLIYLDFIKLNQKAVYLFDFSQDDSEEVHFYFIFFALKKCVYLNRHIQKVLSPDMQNEIHQQLLSLSSRMKEFDSKTNKKLLCSIEMCKLLLKFFLLFNEMNNNNEIYGDNDESISEERSAEKLIYKSVVDKAIRLAECEPDQNVLGTMLLEKSKYTHNFLISTKRQNIMF